MNAFEKLKKELFENDILAYKKANDNGFCIHIKKYSNNIEHLRRCARFSGYKTKLIGEILYFF